MAIAQIGGGLIIPVLPWYREFSVAAQGTATQTLDAANEAAIFFGHIMTEDGASHTIDTTGSSSIGWRSASVTFANAGTTVKVGIAPLDTAAGPPTRAVNVADVITFDVAASFTGGGGGITANAWQTSVPTSGTKTIAHGDVVAVCFQITALGGADSVLVTGATVASNTSQGRPGVTTFLGGSYASSNSIPNMVITFSDGALGFFYGASAFTTLTGSTNWNNGTAVREYGNRFSFPFPVRISGGIFIFDNAATTADGEFILYSGPLTSPVAQRTISLDAHTYPDVRTVTALFPTPYDAAAGEDLALAMKPTTASNWTTSFKQVHDLSHSKGDPLGLDMYGVSRGSSGAFTATNSNKDRFPVGVLLSGFEHGVSPTYGLGI
jgi:hypothetical protein